MQFRRRELTSWLISSSIFMAVEGEKKREKKKRKNDRTASTIEENLISQSIITRISRGNNGTHGQSCNSSGSSIYDNSSTRQFYRGILYIPFARKPHIPYPLSVINARVLSYSLVTARETVGFVTFVFTIKLIAPKKVKKKILSSYTWYICSPCYIFDKM